MTGGGFCFGGIAQMVNILAEQEHYVLVSDGRSCTVVERRAGKYYPLGHCSDPGRPLDDANVGEFLRRGGCYAEPTGRRLLAEVATQWRELAEHIR